VGLGGPVLYTMITSSYQNAYGDLYSSPSEYFNAPYVNGIETLLPNLAPLEALVQGGRLPQYAVFSSTTPNTGDAMLDAVMAVPDNALFKLGFGSSPLLTNSMRLDYALDSFANPDGAVGIAPQAGAPAAANPANPLRIALKKNDLRNWAPQAPVLLCGGHSDPMVFYSVNTGTMAAYWAPQVGAGLVTILDVDPGVSMEQGGLPTQIGTIAAGVMARNPAASPAELAAAVRTEVLVTFGQYFTSGAPNSPQGVVAAAVANVAAQAVATFLAQGVTSPLEMAPNVASAVISYYHGTLAATACQVATRSFFANFQ
jgi:hypothetical protein